MKIFTSLLLLLSCLFVNAKEFKILHLTTSHIVIGGKQCSSGSVFSDADPIEWTSPRQAMKVVDTSTMEQSLVVAEKYERSKSPNLASYISTSKQLSTRRGAIINTMELGMALDDTFYLLDTLKVQSKLPVDADRFFFAVYDYNGESINKKLSSDPSGAIIFDRSLYSVDGKGIEPFDTNLSIYYLDRRSGTKTLITDRMLLLPL